MIPSFFRPLMSCSRSLLCPAAIKIGKYAWEKHVNFRFASTEAKPAGDGKTSDKATNSKKKEEWDFSDTLGAVSTVLMIGSLGAYMYYVRTSNTRKEDVEDSVRARIYVSPIEMAELRRESTLKTKDFKTWCVELKKRYPSGMITASQSMEFVSEMCGKIFTDGSLPNGHYVERMILGLFEGEDGSERKETIPVHELLTGLSCAFGGSVQERLRILYEMVESPKKTIEVDDLTTLVSYCGNTFQIPSRFFVKQQKKWPLPEFRKKIPREMVEEAILVQKKRGKPVVSPKEFSFEEFFELMRNRGVCIWGECYGNDIPVRPA